MSTGNGRPALPRAIVSGPDKYGNRLVQALDPTGEEIHRDSFDTNRADARQRFCDSVNVKWKKGRTFNVHSDEDCNWFGAIILQGAELADQKATDPAANDVKFNRVTAAELATTNYPVEYFIRGILAVGLTTLIIGQNKTLKTSIALAQAIAIASGRPFLNHFEVERTARVAVFSGESGLPTLKDVCMRICDSMGIFLADLSIVFSDCIPQVGHIFHMEALRRFLLDDEIEKLYIDPAYLAMQTNGGESSIFAMGPLLRSISELCRELNVTLTILHHCKKSVADPFAPGSLSDASFSGFAEFARQWIIINRRAEFDPRTGFNPLTLSVGSSLGHGGLWGLNVNEGVWSGPGTRIWDAQIVSLDELDQSTEEAKAVAREAKRAAEVERDKPELLKTLTKLPDLTGTKTKIRERCTVSGERFNRAWAAILNGGDLLPVTITQGNNRSYEAFQLDAKHR